MTREVRRLLSLRGLKHGHGRADAVRLWFILWSHARWSGKTHDVWEPAKMFASEAGFSIRRFQRALALLRDSGLIATRWGRPGAYRKCVRLITLQPKVSRQRNPRIATPGPTTWTALSRMIDRDRPGTCIGLAMAIYAVASMSNAGHVDGPQVCHVPLAVLRDLTGTSHGAAFYERLAVLERAGIIERVGERWIDGIRIMDLRDAQEIEMQRAVDRLPRLAHAPMRVCRPDRDFRPSSSWDRGPPPRHVDAQEFSPDVEPDDWVEV